MHEALQYTSKINFQSVNNAILADNLSFLESTLVKLSPEKSLCFLLDEKRELSFKPGFEMELVKRMKSGVSLILKGTMESLIEGITRIKGCGFGLIPSGDDFIAGMLSGLYLTQEIFSMDLSEIRKKIYEAALGENLISNTFLSLAEEGLCRTVQEFYTFLFI